jgi:hypothetical protein
MMHQKASRFSKSTIIYSMLLVALIAVVSIMAYTPPVSRDALIHHLAVPKLYLKHGGIYEIPDLFFSYYPMNLTLLYAIPLYFNHDILAKFIHFTFALLTAAMLYRYIARRLNTEYALLGSLFFLSIPIIVYQSTIVYVDLGLVCFLFAAMLHLFKWVENNFNIKYLMLSAIFCGLALGTKYNGLVGLFLLGMFVPFIYARYHADQASHARCAILYSTTYVIIALTVFSPWMVRNMVWTGNPVHPLYNSVFNRQTVIPENSECTDMACETNQTKKSGGLSHLVIRRDLYKESGLEIALTPLRVFFQGRDNDPKYFDGKANPFLLLLPIFAFFGIRSDHGQIRTEKMIMVFFSILFLLYACAQTVIRIRYFAPIFPPLVALSMFGLAWIEKYLRKREPTISNVSKNIMVYGIIIVMLGLNAGYIAERFNYMEPVGFISGAVSRDEYIQKFRPEYASLQYANRHLSENDRILGVYAGNRGYYSDIAISFSLNLLQELAADAWSARDISHGLYERNITYLLVNYELFNFWVKNYSLHEKQMLKDFFEQLTITEFSKDKYGLLRVL